MRMLHPIMVMALAVAAMLMPELPRCGATQHPDHACCSPHVLSATPACCRAAAAPLAEVASQGSTAVGISGLGYSPILIRNSNLHNCGNHHINPATQIPAPSPATILRT